MNREARVEKSVPDFCVLFAESALRLASTGVKEQAEKVMRAIFDPSFDAKELRGYVNRVENCELILTEKIENELRRKVL